MDESATSPHLLNWIQLACVLIFGGEVLYEFHIALLLEDQTPVSEWVHLMVELVAISLLIYGIILSRRRRRQLRSSAALAGRRLHDLRADFDAIIRMRFKEWQLSDAEQDVALLTLRGVRNVDIARMRHTAEGTVKSQLSSIFRKAHVRTRNELLGMFMEELLDFGAADPDATT